MFSISETTVAWARLGYEQIQNGVEKSFLQGDSGVWISRDRLGLDSDAGASMPKRTLPDEYVARESALTDWVALGYDIDVARRVLLMLSRSFGWSETHGLRLRPGDQVWAVYHSYYPRLTGWRRWVGSFRPDELEMETLFRDLKKAAPPGRTIDLHPAVTVGELVKLLEQ